MAYTVIPPTLSVYIVPERVLAETRQFLYERGRSGNEGVVLWLGNVVDDTTAHILIAYTPRQVTYQGFGLAVEIPEEERLRIAMSLPLGVFVLAKVHSHAEEAYHSAVDDRNPYLNHEGAVSIVVPYFGRGPELKLVECSVNTFSRDRGWTELNASEIARRFVVAR